jgi:hypothetical protein
MSHNYSVVRQCAHSLTLVAASSTVSSPTCLSTHARTSDKYRRLAQVLEKPTRRSQLTHAPRHWPRRPMPVAYQAISQAIHSSTHLSNHTHTHNGRARETHIHIDIHKHTHTNTHTLTHTHKYVNQSTKPQKRSKQTNLSGPSISSGGTCLQGRSAKPQVHGDGHMI